MNKKLSYLLMLIESIFIVAFGVLFLLHKTSENYSTWTICFNEVFAIVPCVIVGIFILISIALMIVKKSFSWMTFSWIVSTILSLVIVETSAHFYLSFGTNLQYLYVSFVALGYSIHVGIFIYFNNKNKS